MATARKRPAERRRAKTGYALADWTKAKQDKFLASLAATANVRAASRSIRFQEAAAYDFRRKFAKFRAAWAEALSEGYARLELMMLERAMKALLPPGKEAVPDATRTKLEEYSNKLAMTLLAAHKAAARGERPAEPAPLARRSGTARSRLEATLAQMQERMKIDDDDATSNAADRPAHFLPSEEGGERG